MEKIISLRDTQIQNLENNVVILGKGNSKLQLLYDETKRVSSLQSDFASQIIKLADENKKGKFMCSIPNLPDWCYDEN